MNMYRASMGATLKLPYCWMNDWPNDLTQLKDQLSFQLLALTPSIDSHPLSQYLQKQQQRERDEDNNNNNSYTSMALLVGNEGSGLSEEAMQLSSAKVRIEMSPQRADSLNVAACTAVACYTLAIHMGLITG